MLSIIIPAYNVEKTILRSLQSIDSSIENPCQVIVVNDCSTDHTAEVVKTYQSRRHGISLVNMEKNSGPGLCRDFGFQFATEPWVLYFDGDDEIVPGIVDSAIEELNKENLDVGLFPYKVRDYSDEGILKDMWEIDKKVFYSHGETILEPSTDPEILQITNYPWNKICRRQFLDDIQIQFGPFRMNEDIYPHWQILTQAKKVKFFMRHLVRYSLSSKGHATNVNNRQRFQVVDVLIKTKKLLDSLPNGYLFKPSFFRFSYTVLCWAYDSIHESLKPEFKNTIRRFFYTLDDKDLGLLMVSGDYVVNYFYWIMQ